ncbi:tetratricopeptide repeat protein 34 [Callorhinchus milii]|uniref:tetratricopeptide repeat protein 34 n=1 Tax=Callorhinchus milii TaxID=7868 RepID=UPI001C3F8A15|nr:tetratricopeptide repeat protein 34 [Callorhinchus milii]
MWKEGLTERAGSATDVGPRGHPGISPGNVQPGSGLSEDQMASQGPPVNIGVAAVFLSDEPLSSTLAVDALVRGGRHEEAIGRCNALLNAHPERSLQLQLLLTRALAWVLSGRHGRNGVVDYLQAFANRREETLDFITTRQRDHLPRIVEAFCDYVSHHHRDQDTPSHLLSDCQHFLQEVAPRALPHPHPDPHPRPDPGKAETSNSGTPAQILVERAALRYAAGAGESDAVLDLASAFEVSPGLAERRFRELFPPQDATAILDHAKRFAESRFSEYRETVRCRVELRCEGGAELLAQVLPVLRLVLRLEPDNNRDLQIRLADCALLSGDTAGSLRACERLLDSDRQTYHNTILALRGFCHLRALQTSEALEDFQAVLEHDSPHPGSCVKALCGRGLTRMVAGSNYLAALDYITACRLRLDETALVTKSYVPWNLRGLLFKVLQEEGQKILRGKASQPLASPTARGEQGAERGFQNAFFKEGDVLGVHSLASMLLELDPSDVESRILSADALYQLDRVEEAHKLLLVSLNSTGQRPSVLARLALLQLKKGFLYDANQLIKKVIQIGDTSCLLPIMDIFKADDRALMERHCHSNAMSILQNKEGDTYVKEAVAYLSLAIISSGGTASDALLTRARCYSHLNQKKTAIFDFGSILKTSPNHVQALCGRAFTYAILCKQKEAVQDMVLALKADQTLALGEVQSLRPEAQALITGWLHEHCTRSLTGAQAANRGSLAPEELLNLQVISRSLLTIDENNPAWHLLGVDISIAEGMYEDALGDLQEAFGTSLGNVCAKARYGIIQATKGNLQLATQNLSSLAERDNRDLGFLLGFLDIKVRRLIAQVASQEANALAKENRQEKALRCHTLAVLASDRARYVRARATCLARLKQYERALGDLSQLIEQGRSPEPVEDYCARGHVRLLVLRTARPGRLSLSQRFHHAALSSFERGLFEDAWRLADSGMVVDEANVELRRLKARIKREASGCVVH